MIERIRNLPELRNLLNIILDLGLEYYRQGSWSGRSIKKGSREIRDFLFWGTSCELDSQLFYAGVCICIKLFLKYLNLFKRNRPFNILLLKIVFFCHVFCFSFPIIFILNVVLFIYSVDL